MVYAVLFGGVLWLKRDDAADRARTTSISVRRVMGYGLIQFMLLWPLRVSAAPQDLPDAFVTRLEMLALLETLNAELLSNPSATVTLERWCGAHHLAPEAKVVARLMRGENKAISPEDRQRLGVTAEEPVRYRRVQLLCGEKMLSEADNWYVPGRLTPEMNRRLDETDEPFGRVVKALEFHRVTLSAALLWRPLPEGWELAPPPLPFAPGLMQVPDHVLEHRAILYTRAHVPFSLLVETYGRDVLDFPLTPER
jgi:chorismate-pyruvate lyase